MDFSQKIDREELREVFRRPFDPDIWRTLLIQVFGANKLYQQPKPRELDNGENAKVQGFDLGEIVTSDKYTIGLFQFEIKSGHNIPMNRVGLRGLVEKEIKYFYDAALVVYYNDTQWRLSFICDLQGEKTAPKRFTYVFGESSQYYRTPIRQFELIKTKGATKDVIHEAFSVEALNKEFYGFIAKRFYELVGATTGQGKNKTEHKRIMRLPGEQDTLVYQEFAVRLIGRTVFCWFLKEKKSGDGMPLLTAELLSVKSLETYNDYYHTVLERIFFQTLNTPIKDRVDSLPKGCELIPFLNGGLFDYRPHDFYAPEEDGLSKYRDELKIPDEWFAALFAELEQYNFTIDENSPDDIEVSVDPEMLGRIFENLLAEIDPDSGETARKATGSFYTPREIVDYMAVESLVYYLNRKTSIDKDDIYPLFKSIGTTEFSAQRREKLLVALDELKILDPACGSGAFPMGILAKITGALKILDEHGAWWKERQLRRIDNAKVRQEMQEKLDTATVEYARKIGIIQNTLYGVDIQPIAAEISKLRCFLTLIVDENVDDSKPNRGVDPLPNLEFKFITADSLLKLPDVSDFGGLFGRDTTYELAEKLRQLRIDYLQSYGKDKMRIKYDYITTQFQLRSLHSEESGMVDTKSRECLISEWNPFTNEKSDWFDPEWMFGVTDGFDIVIGNPPYINLSKINVETRGKYKASSYKTFENTGDIYALFYERGSQLLKDNGVLSFITSRQWMQASYGKSLRKFLAEKVGILQLIDFGQVKIFEGATVFVDILMLLKKKGKTTPYGCFIPVGFDIVRTDIRDFFALHRSELKNLSEGTWSVSDFQSINEKIEAVGKPIKQWKGIEFYAGIKSALNEAFHISESKRTELIAADPKNAEIIKPLLRGKDIKRYGYDYKNLHIINTHNGLRSAGLPRIDVVNDYPEIHNHLCQWQTELEERLDKGEHWTNLRNCAFLLEFDKPKIVWIEISDRANYTYDDKGMFLTNSAYFLTCDDKNVEIKYILALLNSQVSDFYFSQKTARIAGGRKRYTKQYVEQIPIPYIDREKQKPFADKADEVLAAKAANPAADTSALESEIDRMVYDLYGLTQEEIKIIEK